MEASNSNFEFEPSQDPQPLSQSAAFSQAQTQELFDEAQFDQNPFCESADGFDVKPECSFCGRRDSCRCFNFPPSEYNQEGSTINVPNYDYT
jgi:hypothetical protein